MELFTKLGLKEVCNIVAQLGLSTDLISIHGCNIEADGKTYNYEKKGNSIFITDSDGKAVRISINYTEEPQTDFYGRDIIYLKHEINVDYVLDNGNLVNLYNNISLDRGYETFENVQRHDLMDGLRCTYCDADHDLASFSLGLDRICLKDNNQIYEFNNQGIVCGRRVVSDDGKTLVSVGGDETPDKDLIFTFDFEEEMNKLERIIRSNEDVHPFTKEVLEDTKRMLLRRNRYVQDYKNYYTYDIKEAQKAKDIREVLMKELDTSIIAPEGLEAVSRDLYQRRMNNPKQLRRR